MAKKQSLPASLKLTLSKIHEGYKDQLQDTDDAIRGYEASIKSAKKYKKDIEADMVAIEQIIGVEVENVENQDEKSQRD